MLYSETELKKRLKSGCPVFYFYASDEALVRSAAAKLDLPIVHNPCPANGETRRQEVKELIESLSMRYPDLKQKLFGAMQRYPLYGWGTGDEREM